MSGLPSLDVGEPELRLLRAILRSCVPDRTVWAFGSRARRTAKPFSDLDLAVIGENPLPLDTLAQLNEALAESDLPWKVDVVDWASTSESFRRIIERDRIAVQEACNGTVSGNGRTNPGPGTDAVT